MISYSMWLDVDILNICVHVLNFFLFRMKNEKNSSLQIIFGDRILRKIQLAVKKRIFGHRNLKHLPLGNAR